MEVNQNSKPTARWIIKNLVLAVALLAALLVKRIPE